MEALFLGVKPVNFPAPVLEEGLTGEEMEEEGKNGVGEEEEGKEEILGAGQAKVSANSSAILFEFEEEGEELSKKGSLEGDEEEEEAVCGLWGFFT